MVIWVSIDKDGSSSGVDEFFLSSVDSLYKRADMSNVADSDGWLIVLCKGNKNYADFPRCDCTHPSYPEILFLVFDIVCHPWVTSCQQGGLAYR